MQLDGKALRFVHMVVEEFIAAKSAEDGLANGEEWDGNDVEFLRNLAAEMAQAIEAEQPVKVEPRPIVATDARACFLSPIFDSKPA